MCGNLKKKITKKTKNEKTTNKPKNKHIKNVKTKQITYIHTKNK